MAQQLVHNVPTTCQQRTQRVKNTQTAHTMTQQLIPKTQRVNSVSTHAHARAHQVNDVPTTHTQRVNNSSNFTVNHILCSYTDRPTSQTIKRISSTDNIRHGKLGEQIEITGNWGRMDADSKDSLTPTRASRLESGVSARGDNSASDMSDEFFLFRFLSFSSDAGGLQQKKYCLTI